MKYGGVTLGQVEAAINKLGGQEVWDAWLRDEKTVTVEDAIRLFFDKHGRRIPKGLQTRVCDAKRGLQLDQPKLDKEVDFANRITRLHGCLSIDTKVTAAQLMAETERLLAIIRGKLQIANIANGIYLPVVLPKLVTDDLGAELELYLAGVNNSYKKTFSDRSFNNYLKGDLSGKVSVVDGSRHNQLIERMKQGPVIGLHFPNPLQGFSLNASREQMSTLPSVRRSRQDEGGEGFILSGMDTPIAMMMYPDILARNWNTPGLYLAALQWQSAASSLLFRGNLAFDYMDILAHPYAYFSGGLLFLG